MSKRLTRICLSLAPALLLFGQSTSFAKQQTNYGKENSPVQEVDKGYKRGRLEVKNALDAVRESRKNNLRDKAEKAREFGKDKIGQAKALREQKREELKVRLAQLKDKRKAQIAERIATRVENINKRRVAHFKAVLSRLSLILDKIDTRVSHAKDSGLDTSAVESAVSGARSAISDADNAVGLQESKVYEFTISGDETLRSDIGSTVSLLQSDLKTVYGSVKGARDAVRSAFLSLKSLKEAK